MKTVIIIPARLGSTRLSRKPLRMIAGMTLIERVYRQCKRAQGIDMVVIATDSDEIAEHVNGFGAGAIMTPGNCANGTERVANAAKQLSEEFEIIINVQGDEPLIEPLVIEKIADSFDNNNINIATPISSLQEKKDIDNPNIVKVVTDANDDILYFSRAVIPYNNMHSEHSSETYWRHIGLYAFRSKILEEISRLPQTALEKEENLEQLRWLYHGYKIRAIPVQYISVEVNTEEDVLEVERLLGSKK
jgi:3-deoxy-manno-octulosonate cytidylyltransferase (CMP-KDO synthetase)